MTSTITITDELLDGKKMLTQNEKMKETMRVNPGTVFWNFNLPAIKTCPSAGDCMKFCYATQGRYIFGSVKNSMERHYLKSLQEWFTDVMDEEIKWRNKNARRKHCDLYIRVHDSGDYYSIAYARKWIEIAKCNPDVTFYSYTKCVSMWHHLIDNGEKPSNFHIIMSEGGKGDAKIRPDDVRAIVVNSVEDITGDMMDATGNDMIAMKAKIIALPYHGSKKVTV